MLAAQMELITNALSHICEETNASSIRTEHGTIIRSMQTRYSTSDWGSFHDMVNRYHAPYLLEKRILNSAMKEFLEEHPEAFPPGLYADNKYVISVRRPTKKV